MRPRHSRMSAVIALSIFALTGGLMIPLGHAGYGPTGLPVRGAGLTRFGRRSTARAKLIRSRL